MHVASHAEAMLEAPSGQPCGCAHAHSHAEARFARTLVGIVLVLNSLVAPRLSEGAEGVASASALLGALLLGAPILQVAVKDLRQGAFNTSILVALAIMALFASAHYAEAGVVSFFMLLGQIIESRTAEGAMESIRSLVKLTPTRARRVRESTEEEVPAHTLAVDDIIRVRPGDTVAADGVVIRGRSSLDEATITGESLPTDKTVGDEVFAGTMNHTGVLDIRITRAGSDTTLGRVRDLILAAEKTRLPMVRIMDEYLGYYTPLVLAIGGLVWVLTHDLERVVAIFIVSCPCAFVLASPTAMVAALSAAARLGILVKNVADLELVARINAFVFDKTGTLTTGRLVVRRLMPLDSVQPAELLHLAASVEQFSNHPTAKALTGLAQEAGIPLTKPDDFAEVAGRGIAATVDGVEVLTGRAQWLLDNGVPEGFARSVDVPEAEGWSLVFVARKHRCVGWIGLQDQIRGEAEAVLAGLRERNVRRLAMVSGDRQAVVERVALEIGCEEARGECLPQDKVDFVRSVRANGYRVAVVGDGVNDGPALAAGDLGIAMGAAGSEVAIQSATIALMNNDLRRLPFLMTLSAETRRVIRQNFLLGLAFVVGGLFLGAMKFISPIVAALFHVSGSLLVVFNSFRLMRLGEELEPSPHGRIRPVGNHEDAPPVRAVGIAAPRPNAEPPTTPP